ncbi:Dimethyladenosine transferase 2, mitochondrial [Tupaia chinensis]|uniref:Dimethyladenosine transferase 2, mitochondrial n=1 Tax=Tupaia chinensis TaxID=246437 RepID=L9JG34_TUPCH|nr:Dimethyladenosine transferase 2, mitochondrial [Tupaia chinensis]
MAAYVLSQSSLGSPTTPAETPLASAPRLPLRTPRGWPAGRGPRGSGRPRRQRRSIERERLERKRRGRATIEYEPGHCPDGLFPNRSTHDPQVLPSLDFNESPSWVSKCRLEPKRYVTNRRLAETLAQILRGKRKKPRHLFLECNPGIPLKVIGIFPIKSERKALWKLIYDLYSCTSIYGHGRIELNMFISEKEYKEPWSSFDIYTQNGLLEKPKRRELVEQIQQNLYFIRMTPRRNLFTENLTPINYDVFFHMVKHCFGKRSAKLIDHLRSLSPVDAMDILTQIGKNEKVKISSIYPQDFRRLFETIEHSKDYTYKWLYDDSMEDNRVEN